MESIVILNALGINHFAFEKINEKQSGIERAIERGRQFESAAEVAVLVAADSDFAFPENIKPIPCMSSDAKDIFSAIYKAAQNYQTIFFAYADAPFLDVELAGELLHIHKKYKAEYTFADGFPYGLAAEVLDIGLVKILQSIADLGNIKDNRNFIFDCLKKNINSYDIETIIAPINIQELRLEFFANNKRNLKLCSVFEDISAKNYAELIIKREKKLFTLPAFYAIEISQIRSVEKIYLPEIKSNTSEKFLSYKNFKIIIDKISAYSDDAVVSLSIIGEAFLHPDISKMIDYCLQQKNISLLLETSGVDFDEEKILEIKSLYENKNTSGKIFWIISLDAFSKEKYAEVSKLEVKNAEVLFNKACQNIFTLQKIFGENIFPQFVRMNENENELESFYRYWKEKINSVLIQKYDNLAGQLENRMVADLSPIQRNVCWHLKRDMYILTDGTVIMCKEDIINKKSFGNIFTDTPETIRENIFKIYCEQINKNYKGICENCDEYYTYNF